MKSKHDVPTCSKQDRGRGETHDDISSDLRLRIPMLQSRLLWQNTLKQLKVERCCGCVDGLRRLQNAKQFSTQSPPNASANDTSNQPSTGSKESSKGAAKVQQRVPREVFALPALSEESTMILGRALHKPATSSLRCTVLDEHGRVKVVNGDYKRSALVSEFSLLPRDLRKVDVSEHNIVPAILVRERSILLTLLHIRALIKHNEVLLFNSQTESGNKNQGVFLYDLEHRLKQRNSKAPYEQRALEAVLVSVVSTLDSEAKMHTLMVKNVLSDLEKSIDREKLRLLLSTSKQLSAFKQKATLIRDALGELIDQDDVLADLHLTLKAKKRPLTNSNDHSDLEFMLESYYNYCDEIVQTVTSLASDIKNSEDVTTILLDSNRNTLMLLELRLQLGMMALSGGSVVAALYGMNLMNFMEEKWWGFPLITSLACVVTVSIAVAASRRLRQVRRMHMSSHGMLNQTAKERAKYSQ